MKTAWAVYLGANTPERLAREWMITTQQARKFLSAAVTCGFVSCNLSGVFSAVIL